MIYKDEDKQTIYEYLKEFDKETKRREEFSSALKRELVKGINAQKELEKSKEKSIEESIIEEE